MADEEKVVHEHREVRGGGGGTTVVAVVLLVALLVVLFLVFGRGLIGGGAVDGVTDIQADVNIDTPVGGE
jgi:hypothetical protein